MKITPYVSKFELRWNLAQELKKLKKKEDRKYFLNDWKCTDKKFNLGIFK